jgi:hypothetical protein
MHNGRAEGCWHHLVLQHCKALCFCDACREPRCRRQVLASPRALHQRARPAPSALPRRSLRRGQGSRRCTLHTGLNAAAVSQSISQGIREHACDATRLHLASVGPPSAPAQSTGSTALKPEHIGRTCSCCGLQGQPKLSQRSHLGGVWRLVYSSGFAASRSTGGSRPGLPINLLPAEFGQVRSMLHELHVTRPCRISLLVHEGDAPV